MKTRTRVTLGEPHPHMGSLISSYQDGLTNAPETEMVERHLLECERCQTFYATLQQARELVGELPGSDPDLLSTSNLYSGIMTRTTARQKAAKPPAERGLKKLIAKSKKPDQSAKPKAENVTPTKLKKAEKAKSRK